MSVAQAQETIDAREFAEWMAFYRIRPFGEAAEDYRSAMIGATIANTVPRKAGSRRAKITDFLLFEEHDDEAQTQAIVRTYFKAVEPEQIDEEHGEE